MISQLPPDPHLPGLSALFDEGSVLALLTEGLQPTDGVDITACRPRYVRYKPETTCLVQYDLTVNDHRGERVTTTAHIKVFADDRAGHHAKSASADRLQERAAQRQDDLSLPRVAYLAAVDGLLQVYPIDRDLRFLVRASDAGLMTGVLRKSLSAFAGVSVMAEPELIRYKPERKALLRYSLRDGPVDRLYGKVHAADRTELLAVQTRTLIGAGVTTPRVLFTLPRRRFVAHQEVAGMPLASLRESAAYVDCMEPLAQALRHVQSVDLPHLPAHGIKDIAAETEAGARWLGRIAPHLASRLSGLSESITSRLASLNDRVTTCHGDFYDDQALVSADGLAIIDLDEMRHSHPLLDIGNMLAHLTVAAGDRIPAARDAFLTAVRRYEPWAESEIALFEALAVLKLAPGPFRRLEPDWPVGIERILELAEACLAGKPSPPYPATTPRGRPAPGPSSRLPLPLPLPLQERGERATASGSRGHSVEALADAALPQLSTLQDRVAMTTMLADATGDASLSVTRIDLVRHKAGRRAVLRYEIDRHHGGNVRSGLLYGKTFASGRGPRVYAISQEICSAQAFGPRVSLPEPVAFLSDVKLLVQKPVAGSPVAETLLAGDIDIATRIARSLRRFHTSVLALGRAHDLAQELSPLQMRTDQVIARCPELRPRAEACLARIHEIGENAVPWRYRPVHRDFYHAQVLMDDGNLAVLDLDDAALSEPAVDVANFAAHLMLLGIQMHASSTALTPVEHAFMNTYRRLDPDLDRHLTRFLTATTLVRLAGIHISRADGESLATALLERASALLAVEMPARAVA